MARYREEALTGTKWTLARAMRTVAMPGATPYFLFEEEEYTELSDGRRLNVVSTQLSFIVTDPQASFDLINPNTGAVIGASSFQDALILAHSLYMHAANLRDNPLPAP